jgi:hypothetical protein
MKSEPSSQMIQYAELVKKPSLFQSFTGLDIEALHNLLAAFQEAYDADLADRASQKEKIKTGR